MGIIQVTEQLFLDIFRHNILSPNSSLFS